MAERLRVCPRCTRILRQPVPARLTRQYASAAAAAITPAPSIEQMTGSPPRIARHDPVQPPSVKRPADRRTQLLRQYASLLQSNPLIVLYQHSNLKSPEWVGVRRELTIALRKVDAERKSKGLNTSDIADNIRIQVINTGVFYMALRIVEYFDRKTQGLDDANSHFTSRAASDAAKSHNGQHSLEPLLNGSVALLTMPAVSPDHLKAALSILSPKGPSFAAPRKRVAPGLYEPRVQAGLRKLMLLGARVEGQTFDFEGTRWVGSIEGGIDGLRGQIVAMLQNFGANVTNTLQSTSSNLWLTMESHRSVLEEEQKLKEESSTTESP
ncbi:MAG: hypothetical protein GOMPHAMPRED_002020 [Gomphillus americanus]|uniref:Uncharacterized protein n=1 Tax=Gomphillus americanus TaxID=1940652 RepID=A0A8H3FCP6_9LECA|nr:MAG: hypothetical protein GOMPHAMPRED_002020 [Gomphillus americanus]